MSRIELKGSGKRLLQAPATGGMLRPGSALLLSLLLAAVLPLTSCVKYKESAVRNSTGGAPSPYQPVSPDSLAGQIREVRTISGRNSIAEHEEFQAVLLRSPEVASLHQEYQSDPSNLQAAHCLAGTLVREGLLFKGLDVYHKILQRKPNDALAELGLARIWDRWNEPAIALQHVMLANHYSPGSAEILETLGRIQLHKGDFTAAREAFLAASMVSPKEPAILANTGYALMKMGQWEASADYFRRALTIDPSLEEARNNLGIVLARSGDTQGALLEFLAVNDMPAAYNNLGVVYLQQRRWTDAAQTFSKALELQPNYPRARQNLALAQSHEPPPTVVNLPPFVESVSSQARIDRLKVETAVEAAPAEVALGKLDGSFEMNSSRPDHLADVPRPPGTLGKPLVASTAMLADLLGADPSLQPGDNALGEDAPFAARSEQVAIGAMTPSAAQDPFALLPGRSELQTAAFTITAEEAVVPREVVSLALPSRDALSDPGLNVLNLQSASEESAEWPVAAELKRSWIPANLVELALPPLGERLKAVDSGNLGASMRLPLPVLTALSSTPQHVELSSQLEVPVINLPRLQEQDEATQGVIRLFFSTDVPETLVARELAPIAAVGNSDSQRSPRAWKSASGTDGLLSLAPDRVVMIPGWDVSGDVGVVELNPLPSTSASELKYDLPRVRAAKLDRPNMHGLVLFRPAFDPVESAVACYFFPGDAGDRAAVMRLPEIEVASALTTTRFNGEVPGFLQVASIDQADDTLPAGYLPSVPPPVDSLWGRPANILLTGIVSVGLLGISLATIWGLGLASPLVLLLASLGALLGLGFSGRLL